VAWVLAPAIAQAQQLELNRYALVVGNSSYASSPLANPVNDARDVGAALEAVGFDSLVRTDLNLAGMEGAVEEFLSRLNPGSTALIYYAGHGVQVQGENYLIPIGETINSESAVRSKSLGLSDLLDRVSQKGVSTLLVFLDSCRDNPFPGVSRSGIRGLSVVASPQVVENLIAYAAEPGETARDGSSRNGIFTEAFLRNLNVEGRSLTDMMTAVRADVMAKTGNTQRPRVDSGLIKPFYFVSADMAQARAKAELARVQQELASLEATSVARAAQIASAKSSQEKRSLEIEQQKQAAIESAKRLELQSAQREADRLAQEVSFRLTDQESRRKLAESEATQLASLKVQADNRRQEYESLTRSNDSIGEYLKQIAAMEKALEEIGKRYTEAGVSMESDMTAWYTARTTTLSMLKPQAWESDTEFRARVQQETIVQEASRNNELRTRKATLQAEQVANEKDLRARLTATETSFLAITYTVKGKQVAATYGTFDRDRKTWPVTVESTDESYPYSATLTHDISRSPNVAQAFQAVQTAIDTKALVGEIDYCVTRGRGATKYALQTSEARVRDLTTGSVILTVKKLPAPPMYRFSEDRLDFFGVLELQSEQQLVVGVGPVGGDTASVLITDSTSRNELPAGEYRLLTKLGDDIDWAWATQLHLKAGVTQDFPLPPEAAIRSVGWRINEETLKQNALVARSSTIKVQNKTAKTLGVGGLITGGISGALAGVCYFLATSAYEQYRNATGTSDLAALGRNTDLYSLLFTVSASLSGAGLAFGGSSLLLAPDIGKAERELQESINRIQKLRSEQLAVWK